MCAYMYVCMYSSLADTLADNLFSHKQHMRILLALHPHQHCTLMIFNFRSFGGYIGQSQHDFNLHSLVANEVECLFIFIGC